MIAYIGGYPQNNWRPGLFSSGMSLINSGIGDAKRRTQLIWLLLGLMALTATYFWLGSRYPALNEKALSGTDTSLDAIGFDILIRTQVGASLLERFFATSINWMYTNWRGMVFGLLFGTLLMSLLSLVRDMQFKNRYANALTGMIIGAPLGVCANCAAPIAKGMLMTGSRQETAFAALLSSPTLNVIVISMALALLPLHLVLLKIAFSIIAILLLVPIVCRIAPTNTVIEPQSSTIELNDYKDHEAQQGLLITLFKIILDHGIRLCIKTLPLMILAGFLGGAAVTLLPLGELASILPNSDRKAFWLLLPMVALFGLFLPVPIAFDIIVTAILLQAGLHPAYAAVLLLTLGVFSIYPYSLLHTSGAGKAANYLSIGLLGLAVIGGIFAYSHNHYLQIKQLSIRQDIIASQKNPIPLPEHSIRQKGQSRESLSVMLSEKAWPWETIKTQGALSIARKPFQKVNDTSAANQAMAFEISDGREYGIKEPLNYLPFKLSLRMGEFRSIAAGDIHRDGWPDILFSSHDGLGLHANRGGKGFVAQNVDIGLPENSYIGSVALVDINNDEWLDMVVSTLDDGLFIAENIEGDFTATNTYQIPNTKDNSLANAMAFGDLDNNGEVDIFLGNVGRTSANVGEKSYVEAQNLLLLQDNGKFKRQLLPEVPSETLSVLMADLTGDNLLDIFVGNDFVPADEIYVNQGGSEFSRIGNSEKIIPYSGITTMSITSADIDNDLIPEIYLAQKNMTNAIRGGIAPQELCREVIDDMERAVCEQYRTLVSVGQDAKRESDLRFCDVMDDKLFRYGCYARIVESMAKTDNAPEQCNYITEAWSIIATECRQHFNPLAKADPELIATQIESKIGVNMLFKLNSDGRYDDVADNFGLVDGGWSWNAKFADLDNDGWQDLFIVTGDPSINNYTPFYLYKNNGAGNFDNIAQRLGFKSLRSFLGYSYIDMDGDGDLDIIAIPGLGNPQVFENTSKLANSIQFQLSDSRGNSRGLGSRIIVEYDGKHQMRDISASGGFLSFDPAVAHFGLGEKGRIDNVKIIWSTGETEIINGPFEAGFSYQISR